MIIGINGFAGSGKDTVGVLIQLLKCSNLSQLTVDDILSHYKDHQWWIEEQSGWEIKKWAGKLKTIATMLTGIPQEKFEDQEFKKTNLGPEWDCNPYGKIGTIHKQPLTVRDFLQRLGTDGLRFGLHENTWVNALMSDYIGMYDIDTDRTTYPNWIITDTRFRNEAQAIKDAGGIVIRVDRPGVKAINNHSSETGLDSWKFDHKIMNGSDIVSLMFSINTILKKENLL